jgi:hypothetical protein
MMSVTCSGGSTPFSIFSSSFTVPKTFGPVEKFWANSSMMASRSGAEIGFRSAAARNRPDLVGVELPENAGRKIPAHGQNQCGNLVGTAQRLGFCRPLGGCIECHRERPLSFHIPGGPSDDLRERHAEPRILVLDDDNRPTRHDPAVDDHFNGLADAMIKRNDGPPAKLHQVGDRHGGGAEQNLDRNRNAHDRLRLVSRLVSSAARAARSASFPKEEPPALSGSDAFCAVELGGSDSNGCFILPAF